MSAISGTAKFIPLLALGLIWPIECLTQAFPLEYERRFSKPEVGKFLDIAAKGDFNGDGVPDLLVGQGPKYGAQFPLSLLRGKGDGTFRDATEEVIRGDLHTLATPVAVAADFNGDGRSDIALYEHALDVPGAPIVLMSRPDGTLHVSSTLSDAVESAHIQDGDPDYGPYMGDVKDASAGDIDNDGDIDLWVEGCGFGDSAFCRRFVINNGDETLTIDPGNRIDPLALHNPRPEFWRHFSNTLVDVDNDGDLDLAMGQMRDKFPEHVNQFSLLFLNDGMGFYPRADRILLPRPKFNKGFTTVDSMTAHDVTEDGLTDLILAHSRRTTTSFGWSGRYIQVLVNKGGGRFVDETATRMDNPPATRRRTSAYYPGSLDNNVGGIAVGDVDRDGFVDLIMGRGYEPITDEAPLVHRNDGRGRFRAVAPNLFNWNDKFAYVQHHEPIDLNGDGLIDFVTVYRDPGPDGSLDTPDDRPSQIFALMARASMFLGAATINSKWRTIDIPGVAKRPVVIAGPPTLRDAEPGVMRLRKVSSRRFEARFQEWNYLDGAHPNEKFDFLVIEPGRHELSEGTRWEAGTFKLSGNRKWKSRKFKKSFPGTPRVFLTLQSHKDAAPVTVRARGITKNGFQAALLEEEKDQRTGHRRETVGYLAVFGKKSNGRLAGGYSDLPYRLAEKSVNQRLMNTLDTMLKLEEEQSRDREVQHSKEGISAMVLGRGFFAQQVTDEQPDTTALRRR